MAVLASAALRLALLTAVLQAHRECLGGCVADFGRGRYREGASFFPDSFELWCCCADRRCAGCVRASFVLFCFRFFFLFFLEGAVRELCTAHAPTGHIRFDDDDVDVDVGVEFEAAAAVALSVS